MSKRTMLFLLIAAAAAVGFVLWHRSRGAVTGATVPGATVAPTVVSPQAVVANAFSDLLNFGANWAAQYFATKSQANPGEAVPYKPPPVTSRGPTTAVPAGATPNVQTTPAGYYA